MLRRRVSYLLAVTATLSFLSSCGRKDLVVVSHPVFPDKYDFGITLKTQAVETKSVVSTVDGVHFTPSWQGGEKMAFWLVPEGGIGDSDSPSAGMGVYRDYMPTTDIEGRPRSTAPGRVDVGAYVIN